MNPSNRRTPSTVVLLVGGASAMFIGVATAPILPLIGAAYGVNVAELGLLVGAYIAGVGFFQIPAGLFALRWGTRETYLGGLALMGLASLPSGLAGNILELSALRFAVGVGGAFSSGTVYSLLASYYSEGQRGKTIGLYFGITNGIGGLVGLLGGAALGLAYGWAWPIELGGGVILVVAVLGLLILPSNKSRIGVTPLAVVWSGSRRVLGSRSIWGLAVGLAGFSAASAVAIDYIAQYFSQVHPIWGIGTAAVIATVGLVFTIPGGIFGGWIGERGFDRRTVLAVAAIIMGCDWLLLPYLQLAFYYLLYAEAGLAVGIVLAVMFTIPSYLDESKGEAVTLGIGLMSTIQQLFTSAFVGMFGIVAVSQGYTAAWTLTGLTALALLPFLLLLKSNRAKKSKPEPG